MSVSPKAHRRALHEIPELDFSLPQTTAYLEGVLSPLGFELSRAGGGLCAYLDAGKEGCTAFRADMDALPIREATGLPYASRHPGRMHACGHDGHMAMVLSLGERAAAQRAALPSNLLLVFQPAEETTGGAKGMCESGVFEKYRVSRIFGAHLWPGLPAGEVYSRPGPLMARSSEVKCKISGRSVHIAKAEEGADATLAAAKLLLACKEMERQELPKDEPRALGFGLLQSGTVCNALSPLARLEGSMRCFSLETYEYMKSRITALAGEIDGETGCKTEIDVNEGYPPLVNDPAYYAGLCRALGDFAPRPLPAPFMQTEDFSFYLQKLPGAFFFIGTGRNVPLHAAAFDMDEAALEAGVEFYWRVLGA